MERGYTLRELADMTGLTHAYLSRLERGDRSPSLEVLIDIAQPLRTTALYLLTGHHDAPCPCCGR